MTFQTSIRMAPRLDERLTVVASIGTRLAIGAYPLTFILVFGWVYGKQALDVAAAANNWASYLNLLLLSGFLLVPPAVARLKRAEARDEDVVLLRDHLALEQVLLLAGLVAALGLAATISRAFPALAEQADMLLIGWYALFAVQALSQIPLMFWLGVTQAAGNFGSAFLLVAVPRGVAVVFLLAGKVFDVAATAMLMASIVTILAGQAALVVVARRHLRALSAAALSERGRARSVLAQNLNAGLVVLVGSMVTLVPVTIVGNRLAESVGHAYAIVTLSNAVGAVVVAMFFPMSLTLADWLERPRGLRSYCVQIAQRVGLVTIGLLGLFWLTYPFCAWFSNACSAGLFAVASLAVAGAGLRLAALGVYHAAAHLGQPRYAMPSVAAEAAAVVAITWLCVDSWKLLALGIAFVAGGVLRLLVAFSVEMRLLMDQRAN
jgi:hypothetical protein